MSLGLSLIISCSKTWNIGRCYITSLLMLIITIKFRQSSNLKSPLLFSKVCLLKKRAVALELTHIHLVPTLCRALCKVLLGAVSSVVLVAQLCLIFCNFTDCSSPGSFVHGIFQARTLEWIAIPFSRGSSQPRDWTRVSCIAGGLFTNWATGESIMQSEPASIGKWQEPSLNYQRN